MTEIFTAKMMGTGSTFQSHAHRSVAQEMKRSRRSFEEVIGDDNFHRANGLDIEIHDGGGIMLVYKGDGSEAYARNPLRGSGWQVRPWGTTKSLFPRSDDVTEGQRAKDDTIGVAQTLAEAVALAERLLIAAADAEG